MADRNAVVEVILRARDTTGRVINRFRRSVRAMGRIARDVTRIFVTLTASIGAAFVALQRLAQQGSKVIAVKRTFARITGDEVAALEMLREATANTVADQQLMESHNMALALGAAESTEEFARMARQARLLGRAQGIDAAEALEKYTVGLARQSKLRLDDLGITLDQEEANERYAAALGRSASSLTENERKIAFRNEAMRQADILVRAMSGGELEAVESSDRLAAAMTNLKDKLATVVAESELVGQFLDAVTDIVTDIIAIFEGDAEHLRDGLSALGGLLGNAFASAFLDGVAAVFDRIDRLILPKFFGIEENFTTFIGAIGQGLAGFADDAEEAAGAFRVALSAAARAAEASGRARRVGEGGTGGPGGIDRSGGVAPIGRIPRVAPRDMSDFFFTTPEARAAAERRRRNLERARLSPFGMPSTVDVAPLSGPVQPFQAGTGPLTGTADEMAEAAERMERAGAVAVSSIFGTANAIAQGSENIAASLVSMITQVTQTLTGGGIFGALVGGIGGLALGFLTRRQDRTPSVRVESYGQDALHQMRQVQGPLRVTTIIEQGGQEIARIERELLDRSERDEVVRYGSGGLELRNRRR